MSLPIPFFFIFIFATATVHALLEIQIEGPHGWAKKLPTRLFRNKLISRFTEAGYITGFHVATIALVTVLAHFPAFFVEQWSFMHEALVLSFVFFHFVFEDFLWFVFNPAYGIGKFSGNYIWWHKKWFLKVPVSYWFGVFIGALLLVFAV